MSSMKKLIVAAVAAIVFIANIQAQNKKWSLKECIDYAILHNIEVKQSQNRIKSLKVERNTLKSSFLPDLNVGASQRFSFGRALNQDNTYEDSNIQNSSFSASAEMPLFTVDDTDPGVVTREAHFGLQGENESQEGACDDNRQHDAELGAKSV